MTQFAESGFEPIERDGAVVHPMYRRRLRAGDLVRITWLSAASPRVQGLSLRLRLPGKSGRKGEGGRLRVADAESPTIVLWMDTAPQVVDVECVEIADGAELQISNRWRLPNGREDEWLNNFGMLVEPSSDAVTLRCSDGYGDDPTFDDLVVKVVVIERTL